MSGSIQQVDVGVLPVKSDTGGIDGNSTFLFFRIAVGFGGSLIDEPHAMLGATVKEHSFRDSGFAGIDVGNNPQVPQVFELSEHGLFVTV